MLFRSKSVLEVEPDSPPVSIPTIIKAMVGRELNEIFPKRIKQKNQDVILSVKGLNGYDRGKKRNVVKDISFDLKRGEVLGVAGLMGAGRTELAMTLFGNANDYIMSGEIEVLGKKVQLNSPKEAIQHGIAYVSEDRKGNGLILIQDIKEKIGRAHV